MMKLSLQGYDNAYATFRAGDDAPAGKLVQVTDDHTVALAASGDFAGLLTHTRDGQCLVQLKGYARLPYLPGSGGEAMGYGYVALAARDGALTPASGGRRLLVVELDAAASVCGVIL